MKDSFTLNVLPKDWNTLKLPSVWLDNLSNDILQVSFEIENANYGVRVDAVEIYYYATDVWGNNIYNGQVYYNTTNKAIDPGKKVKSTSINLPNRSKIHTVYGGIHKIKFADGTTKTYDKVDYYSKMKGGRGRFTISP